MKRLNSSESLGALISVCPPTEDETHRTSKCEYGRGLQSMMMDGLDEEGCVEEGCSQASEKKRRLSLEQVKALEKNFEVENKLEPERKVKLAHELGLQPRQVAVWFQNRRARWKTKQLERDYGLLKANFDALKHNFESLQHENEALANEIRDLKSKLKEGNTESNISVKKEPPLAFDADDNKLSEHSNTPCLPGGSDHPKTDSNNQALAGGGGGAGGERGGGGGGASDSSDSSAILNNDDNSSSSNNVAISSNSPSLLHSSAAPPTTAVNCYQFSDSKLILGDAQRAYQPQFVKIEEHNFFCGDEACNFFSDDQAPTLQWYCSDQWS